jgi:hypothetical protein
MKHHDTDVPRARLARQDSRRSRKAKASNDQDHERRAPRAIHARRRGARRQDHPKKCRGEDGVSLGTAREAAGPEIAGGAQRLKACRARPT